MFTCGPALFGSAPSSGYASYPQAVLADGPELYWRLNETSGTVAADSSGNGRAGLYTEDASLLTAAGLLASSADKGILIPAVVQGVSISLNPLNTYKDWSCECIIKPTDVPPQESVGVIWQLGENGQSCPEIDIQDAGSGKYKFRVMSSGSAPLFTSATSLDYNTTAHVVLTYTSSTYKLKLYINGALDANSATHTYSVHGGVVRLGFARFSSDGYPCRGYMDEAALYQKVLTEQQIAAHYATS